MPNLQVKIDQGYTVTPKEIAELFCAMDNTEQAMFFNHVAVLIKGWRAKGAFDLQMCDVDGCSLLTESGRRVMGVIGQFANEIKPA